MYVSTKFDKKRDIQSVDQFGFVDLNKSISEGFVPSNLALTPDAFDGEVVDPEGLLGKPSDRFEAMRIQESLANGIREHEKGPKTESESKTESE